MFLTVIVITYSYQGAQYPISKPAVLKLLSLRILSDKLLKITEDLKELTKLDFLFVYKFIYKQQCIHYMLT